MDTGNSVMGTHGGGHGRQSDLPRREWIHVERILVSFSKTKAMADNESKASYACGGRHGMPCSSWPSLRSKSQPLGSAPAPGPAPARANDLQTERQLTAWSKVNQQTYL